jgi:hypothetical protein
MEHEGSIAGWILAAWDIVCGALALATRTFARRGRLAHSVS